MQGNKKVYPYVVVLKQRNRRSVELVGLITGLIFIMLQVQRILSEPRSWIVNLLVSITVSGILVHNFSLYRKGKKTNLMVVYIIAAITLLVIPPSSLFVIPFVLMALFVYRATRPEEIGFSETEIVFSGLLGKKISWTDLNNALIKDGILTLDFKNNKLFQKETDDDEDEEDYDVSEEEFNEFCRSQIAKYRASA